MDKEKLTIDEARKIAKEELEKSIKENLDSALIFKYISDLEKEVANKEEAMKYINRLIDKMTDQGATYDPLALLCVIKAILEKGVECE